ncbi:hypothetical protein [Methanosphaerula palustris]|uniref:hypothetical protein n=1 Tax=Methanosphaerula palustris TaxID=475088 RepID=UPI0011D14681|nr:hypothetical protein [Methanosphaerula palustris]
MTTNATPPLDNPVGSSHDSPAWPPSANARIRSLPCDEQRGAAGRPFPRRRATADPCFSTDAGLSVRWGSQSAPGTRPVRVQAGGVLFRTQVKPGCISTGEPAARWSIGRTRR